MTAVAGDAGNGRGGMFFSCLAVTLIVASIATTIFNEVERRRADARLLPSYAGRLCDEVWSQTRPGEPTVAWFRACMNEVASRHTPTKDPTDG